MRAADWITALASADRDARAQGASAFFRKACDDSAPVIAAWMQDEDFASLLVRHALPGRPLVATAGVAVTPENFGRIRAANGAPKLAAVPPDQDAEEFELHFNPVPTAPGETCAAPIQLDILTSKRPEGQGAIANFLRKFGEGIQQVEFDVTNADRATGILAERFAQTPIYPQTRAGADGTRVNFFLATRPDRRKLLIELVEHPAAAK